jgi:hypothetical protein
VWRALSELPLLREAVVSGEVSWTVARMIVGVVTPENEAACLETVRGRTVRAVETLLRAVTTVEATEAETSQEERVPVCVDCSPRVVTKWVVALELARRMAGENLSAWECAEAIAAECVLAVAVGRAGAPVREQRESCPRARRPDGKTESGLRAEVWPRLRWKAPSSRRSERLAPLARGLEDCSPRELDRRLRAAMAFLQQVDFEIGRILRQVVERKLYRELGFESFESCVRERLDLSPRTARRNLQSHHIWFRSHCGPDAAWNRTTLCAYHHHRGVHAGSLAIRGRAPDGLLYTLGIGRFGSGDVKLDVA